METTQQSILDLARTHGLLRPLDLAAHGLPRVSLTRLVRQGRLARVGAGSTPSRTVRCRSTPSWRRSLAGTRGPWEDRADEEGERG